MGKPLAIELGEGKGAIWRWSDRWDRACPTPPLLRRAHALDAWLQRPLGRPCLALLGAALLAGIAEQAHKLLTAPQGQAGWLRAGPVLVVGVLLLLVNQLAEPHGRLEARRGR